MSENPAPVSSGPTPEIWRLDHPEHGLLEVAVGTPAALLTVDPGFPIGAKSSGPGATRGFVLMRDGALVARYRQTKDKKVSIFKDPPDDSTFSANDVVVRRPRVAMTIAPFGDAVRRVTFRDRGEVVHFDPPPGSSAEALLTATEASPWKRVAYPIADGLGKASWAIFVIVVVPAIMRLLDRLWPDVDVPLPDVDAPDVDLPAPEIEISLPSIPWPDIDLPAWVEFLMDWTKVWVPVVLGIALAIAAVRHSRTSRRTRQRWEADRAAQPRRE